MKNLLAILTILVAFASCSDRAGGWHSAPELRTAHELMLEQPDNILHTPDMATLLIEDEGFYTVTITLNNGDVYYGDFMVTE